MSTFCMQELRTLQLEVHHTIKNIDIASSSLSRRQSPNSDVINSFHKDTLKSEMLKEIAKLARTRRKIEFDHLRALQQSERQPHSNNLPPRKAPKPRSNHHSQVEKAIDSLRQRKEQIRNEIQERMESDAKRIHAPNTHTRPVIEPKEAIQPPKQFSFQGIFTCDRAQSRLPIQKYVPETVKPCSCLCSIQKTHSVDSFGACSSKTMHEVYQIQLRFAQTIQNLERSVDVRGRLLQQSLHSYSSDSDSSCIHSYRPKNEPTENEISSRSQSIATTTPSTEQAFSEEKMIQPTQESVDDTKLERPGESLEKQVRFDDQEKESLASALEEENEYSTPKIARNIIFDNVEEDDEDVSDASNLSFMRESVSSDVAINDESFLSEFERLRSEIRAEPKKNSEDFGSKDAVTADFEALKQKRIDICMEIQEETAQLALMACDFSSTKKARLKRRERLMLLRNQFSQVEDRLNAIGS